MFDISAVGARAAIKYKDGSVINIKHWSDEGTPFDCPDVDLSENKKNLNGDMISSRTPSVFAIALTVVPGSLEDLQLNGKCAEAAIQPGNVVEISKLEVESIILDIPQINESGEGTGSAVHQFKWTNGRMKTAPTGPSTSAEGRLAARTYHSRWRSTRRRVPRAATSSSNRRPQ